MALYANRGGDSNVHSYEADVDSIIVTFNDGSAYLYNSVRPGINVVERMKSLAASGQGLNSYISTYVRKNYARKLR